MIIFIFRRRIGVVTSCTQTTPLPHATQHLSDHCIHTHLTCIQSFHHIPVRPHTSMHLAITAARPHPTTTLTHSRTHSHTIIPFARPPGACSPTLSNALFHKRKMYVVSKFEMITRTSTVNAMEGRSWIGARILECNLLPTDFFVERGVLRILQILQLWNKIQNKFCLQWWKLSSSGLPTPERRKLREWLCATLWQVSRVRTGTQC